MAIHQLLPIYILFFADVNECADGTDNCHVNADCMDTIGSFQCTCSIGYSGDGVDNCTGELAWKPALSTAMLLPSLCLLQTSMSVLRVHLSVILTPSAQTPLDSTPAPVSSATLEMEAHALVGHVTACSAARRGWSNLIHQLQGVAHTDRITQCL